MDSNTRYHLKAYLDEIITRCNTEQSRLNHLKDFREKRLKVVRPKMGTDYYAVYIPKENRYRYLGSDSNVDVIRIKEAHYLEMSIKELQREIQLIERFLKSSRDVSHDSINQKLTIAYRGSATSHLSCDDVTVREWKELSERIKDTFGPFRPDELIHKTRDGTLVRSKGEALIYNYLLELGVTFVYELPLRIRLGNKDSLLLPDFTVLSEIDNKSVIFIEHQGMMDDQRYRTGFNEKVYKYWSNNYLPERDVFFTFDSPNGGFDDTPIRRIVARCIWSAPK